MLPLTRQFLSYDDRRQFLFGAFFWLSYVLTMIYLQVSIATLFPILQQHSLFYLRCLHWLMFLHEPQIPRHVMYTFWTVYLWTILKRLLIYWLVCDLKIVIWWFCFWNIESVKLVLVGILGEIELSSQQKIWCFYIEIYNLFPTQ